MRRSAAALAVIPLLFFAVILTDMATAWPFAKHVSEQRIAAFSQMLKTRYDANRKAEYAAANEKFDKYQFWTGILDRVRDPTTLVVLPYLVFSSCLLVSLYRNRSGPLTPWALGLAGACLVCVAVFLHYVVHPFRCVDIGCLVAVLFIVAVTLLAGATMMVVVALVTKRMRASPRQSSAGNP